MAQDPSIFSLISQMCTNVENYDVFSVLGQQVVHAASNHKYHHCVELCFRARALTTHHAVLTGRPPIPPHQPPSQPRRAASPGSPRWPPHPPAWTRSARRARTALAHGCHIYHGGGGGGAAHTARTAGRLTWRERQCFDHRWHRPDHHQSSCDCCRPWHQLVRPVLPEHS
jgi:hypothetical protein